MKASGHFYLIKALGKEDMLTYIKNLAFWQTQRKIVVIISDDWGGARVRSSESRERLIKAGIDMRGSRFDLFDTLESNDDLTALFEILIKHKDHRGNHAVITAAVNVANPDFVKIKEAGFLKYYYEPFTQTQTRHPDHDQVYSLYKKGIELNIFKPEFHGREHLQVKWWLENLQSGNEIVRKAFDEEFWFVQATALSNPLHRGLAAAFDIATLDEVNMQKEIITEGIQLFIKLFGYQPILFVPPAQHFHQSLEPILAKLRIKMIDVPRLRKMPLGKSKSRIKLHYLGQNSQLGLKYLTRNAIFEPNLNKNSDGVNECLAAIENAFRYKMPAIISNHRVAFSGGLDSKNRYKGLKALDFLLGEILKKWPDVEFMSASSFSDILNS